MNKRFDSVDVMLILIAIVILITLLPINQALGLVAIVPLALGAYR